MKENAGAANVILTFDEIAALDKALAEISMSEVFGGTPVKR